MAYPEDLDDSLADTAHLDDPLADITTLNRGRSPAAEAREDRSVPPPVDPDAGTLGAGAAARYKVRRQIGRGGMGEVYLCRDGRIGRDVAMKVLAPGQESIAEARARFLREARIQGQLEHPSIVPVHDLGAYGGHEVGSPGEPGSALRPPGGGVMFTMKYLSGLTLAEIFRRLRKKESAAVHAFARRKLLMAFSSLCLAVDFAHSRGVVHRDLKPANVMLGDFGEVYLLDWGIAKVRRAPGNDAAEGDEPFEAVRTAQGKILGTPGYMSPEQCRGQTAAIDARSDVYALGAILFELLTLEPLHPKGARGEMILETLRGACARPSVRCLDADVPPELEEICVRATRLDPGARYGSVRDLQEAIERYLVGDRDTELRGQMAGRHAQAAAAMALSATAGGPGAEEARRAALREVGRALALEPTNAEAMRALAAVVTVPPRQVPAQVEAEVDALAAVRHRLALRYGIAVDLLGMTFTTLAVLWMGLRDGRMLAALAVLTIASSACKVAAARATQKGPMRVLGYAAYLLNLLAVLSVTRGFGPLIFIPAPISLFTAAYCMVSDSGFRKAVLATGCAGLLAAVALELAGIVPSSYAFQGGSMIILPQAMSFPEVPTLAALTVSSLFLTLTPGLIMMKLQRTLIDAERRSVLQTWHLRQLLPDEARALAGASSNRV